MSGPFFATRDVALVLAIVLWILAIACWGAHLLIKGYWEARSYFYLLKWRFLSASRSYWSVDSPRGMRLWDRWRLTFRYVITGR